MVLVELWNAAGGPEFLDKVRNRRRKVVRWVRKNPGKICLTLSFIGLFIVVARSIQSYVKSHEDSPEDPTDPPVTWPPSRPIVKRSTDHLPPYCLKPIGDPQYADIMASVAIKAAENGRNVEKMQCPLTEKDFMRTYVQFVDSLARVVPHETHDEIAAHFGDRVSCQEWIPMDDKLLFRCSKATYNINSGDTSLIGDPTQFAEFTQRRVLVYGLLFGDYKVAMLSLAANLANTTTSSTASIEYTKSLLKDDNRTEVARYLTAIKDENDVLFAPLSDPSFRRHLLACWFAQPHQNWDYYKNKLNEKCKTEI